MLYNNVRSIGLVIARKMRELETGDLARACFSRNVSRKMALFGVSRKIWRKMARFRQPKRVNGNFNENFREKWRKMAKNGPFKTKNRLRPTGDGPVTT